MKTIGYLIPLLGALAFAGCGTEESPKSDAHESVAATMYYTCAMHPSVRETKPGRCPICGMDLIPAGTAEGSSEMFIPPDQQTRIGVRWAEAGPVKISRTIRSSGRIEYDERKLAVVNPRYSGWIRELAGDYTGIRVARGQQLAVIHSPELLAARKEHLIAIAAKQDPSWSATDMIDGDPAISTRGRLMNFGITDAQIRALEDGTEPPEWMEILSPIDGILVEKEAVEGMYFEPGNKLFFIADISSIWVHADVYEHELSLVRVGQAAEIERPEQPGRPVKGVVSYIYPFLDEATRAVRVRVELKNPTGAYKPGMYVTVVLTRDTDVPLGVPADAVMRTGRRDLVFVDGGDGHIVMREVTIGTSDGTSTAIVSGLSTGERVAYSANFLIDAEARIRGLHPTQTPESDRRSR